MEKAQYEMSTTIEAQAKISIKHQTIENSVRPVVVLIRVQIDILVLKALSEFR